MIKSLKMLGLAATILIAGGSAAQANMASAPGQAPGWSIFGPNHGSGWSIFGPNHGSGWSIFGPNYGSGFGVTPRQISGQPQWSIFAPEYGPSWSIFGPNHGSGWSIFGPNYGSGFGTGMPGATPLSPFWGVPHMVTYVPVPHPVQGVKCDFSGDKSLLAQSVEDCEAVGGTVTKPAKKK